MSSAFSRRWRPGRGGRDGADSVRNHPARAAPSPRGQLEPSCGSACDVVEPDRPAHPARTCEQVIENVAGGNAQQARTATGRRRPASRRSPGRGPSSGPGRRVRADALSGACPGRWLPGAGSVEVPAAPRGGVPDCPDESRRRPGRRGGSETWHGQLDRPAPSGGSP